MLIILLHKLALYSRCIIPPIVFHLLTANDGIKGSHSESPDWLLVLISVIELVLPLVYNPGGTILDSALCGIPAIILTFCMLFYVQDRHSAPNGKKVQPFYDILTHWSERKTRGETHSCTKHTENVPLSEMRKNGAKFLLRGLTDSILYVAFFTVLNTFVQLCEEPPKTAQRIPYLHIVLISWISPKTLFYFFWLAVTMSLLIASSAIIHLVSNSILLNLILWLPASNELRTKMHNNLSRFVEHLPLFHNPWLSRNLRDLWSRRWHQVFRPGFVRLGQRPGHQLAPNNKELGRKLGVLGVFLCSGLLHDYIVLVAIGIDRWDTPGVVGYQTVFFLLQAVGLLVCDASPQLPTWLARTFTFLWLFYTGPIFIDPYIHTKLFITMIVPGNSHLLDPFIAPICPFGTR